MGCNCGKVIHKSRSAEYEKKLREKAKEIKEQEENKDGKNLEGSDRR